MNLTWRRIAFDALAAAYEKHNALGLSGLEAVQNNQHGETALKADIEAEKAVIASSWHIPLRIYSEEHGIVDISQNPRYLAVLDGIDGTVQYKEGPLRNRYGTMFAIFDGIDPSYGDYLVSGIMEHSTGRMLLADKGEGTILFDIKNSYDRLGVKYTSSNKDNLEGSKIYIDEYFEINKQTFSEKLKGFKTSYLRASATYYFDVAIGTAEFALECTRKGNLELATAYGLIKESCGVMVTLDGEDIGTKKYLEFGQEKDEHIPVITAANRTLADKLIEHLRRS